MKAVTEDGSGVELKNAGPGGPERIARHPSDRGSQSARRERRRRILWICVLGWTAFVAFALWWLLVREDGPSVWVFQDRDLNEPGFSDRIQAIFRSDLGLQRAYPWILFGPYLGLIAWFFPLERERLLRNLPLNAAACLAFAFACHELTLRTTATRGRVVMLNLDQLAAPGEPPRGTNEFVRPRRRGDAERFATRAGPIPLREPLPAEVKRHLPPPRPRNWSLRSTIMDLLVYGATTALVHSVNFYVRLRDRERRALFLESNLANARLNTLKAQLQPHFLFNSLNAIATLLRRDPRLAETTLVALSELLRLALSQSERQELALREELEFVGRYLKIQQTRFGDKLRVEEEIEPCALECLVPTLVLQPLVENAIRHGIEPSEKPGTVRVSASRERGKLVLAVEDDGVGLGNGLADSGGLGNRAEVGTGIGLANLRERLQALYGTEHKLELTRREMGGVAVRVEIPWRSPVSPS